VSRQKQRKSPYSIYKSGVKYRLVKIFGWGKIEALDWLNNHVEYTKSMIETNSTMFATAEQINSRRNSHAKHTG